MMPSVTTPTAVPIKMEEDAVSIYVSLRKANIPAAIAEGIAPIITTCYNNVWLRPNASPATAIMAG